MEFVNRSFLATKSDETEKLEAEIARLRRKLRKKDAEIVDIQSEADDLIDSLRDQLEAKEAERASLEQRYEAQLAETGKHERQCLDLRLTVAELHSAADDEYKELKEKLKDEKRQLAESITKNLLSEADYRRKIDQITKKEETVHAALRSHCQKLRAECESSAAKVAELTTQLRSALLNRTETTPHAAPDAPQLTE